MLRKALARIAGVAALALALAACGGSTRQYGNVADCLNSHAASANLTVSTNQDDMDIIAQQAGQGTVVLNDGPQRIQVVVERSVDDAQKSEKEYDAFSDAAGSSRSEIKRYDNTVVVFDKAPTAAEQDAVKGCV